MSNLLEQASLVMIPSGYKEDVVYSEIPINGAGDLTFTRASNGTRINSAGLVEVCPWNLLQYSEQFTNGVWDKGAGLTVTANTTTAPNGTTTADTIADSSSSIEGMSQIIASLANSAYTFSVYVKAVSTATDVRLDLYTGVGEQFFVVFNSLTGVYVTGNGGVYTSTAIGDGWFRLTLTATGSGTTYTRIYPNVQSPSATGSIYAWGAQLNIGSTAKPYFPTTDRLNVPRLTYQNGGGGCPSLLLEKQSTNLALYSEQFDNAAWTKTSGTVTANQAISPDGTQNADKCVVNNGVQVMDMRTASAFSITSGSVYTWSLYVKKAGYSYCQMTAWTGDDPVTVYDLDNGVVVSESGPSHTSTITSVGNGWYRITITRTATDSVAWLRFSPLASATPTDQNGTDGTFIWGAQVEASTYVTSYIPTTSSSATRVADYCSKTGISSLIGQSEGTIFLDGYFQSNDAGWGKVLQVSGTSGNEFIVYFNPSGQFYFELTVSGGIQAAGYLSANGGRVKMAIAYANNDIQIYVNGTSNLTDTSASIPACSNVYLLYGPSAQNKQGQVNQFLLFKTRLTNAELASLTTI